jgi:hypothetical protein
LNHNFELANPHVVIEMMHAGAAIVASPVPGADQQIALQDALPERSAAARAYAIERMNFTVPVAKRELFFTYGNFSGCAGRKRGGVQNFDEGHGNR